MQTVFEILISATAIILFVGFVYWFFGKICKG